MVDTLHWGIVLAAVGETIGEGECEEIAIVAGAGCEVLMYELIEDFGAIEQGMGTETALTGKGKAERFVLVSGRKGEVGTIDAIRFTFQEAITVVEKGIEGEATDVGL